MEKNQIRDNHPGSATLISSLICNVYFRKDVQLNPVPVLRIRINMFLCLPDPDPLVRSTYVNVTSKSNKHKKCKKKLFLHGSADTDPEPYQNVMDPQTWLR